jgi:hypothetical protein
VENNEGIIERLKLLDTDIISFEQTEIFIYGINYLFVDILQPCSQLIKNDGKYSCNLWNSESKPQLCRNYPSNQFVLFGNKEIIREEKMLGQIIAANRSLCPAIATVTMEQIIKDQDHIYRHHLKVPT